MDAPPPSRAAPAAPELATALLAGLPRALERWYEAEHPVVWRLCLGLLADRAEADDLAQDAMLHLHDHLDRWDRSRPWEAWRNSVVLNLCRDRLRRAQARRRAEASAAEVRLPPALADPVAGLERAESTALLAASLGTLSEREREAFVLHELEGRPTAEVAASMAIEEGSVRSLLTLARRRLRNLLASRLERTLPGAEHA